MASNELAAILARRRAKDGSTDDAVVSPIPIVKDRPKSTTSTLEERTPIRPPSSGSIGLGTSEERLQDLSKEKENTTNRKTSSKIQQLQGSLGVLNMGGFPGGGTKTYPGRGAHAKVQSNTEDDYDYESVMKTGSVKPGMMGIAMPGLAKAGVRIPGISEPRKPDEQTGELNPTPGFARAAGPKRRGPSKARMGSGKMGNAAVATAIPTTTSSMVEEETENMTEASSGGTIEQKIEQEQPIESISNAPPIEPSVPENLPASSTGSTVTMPKASGLFDDSSNNESDDGALFGGESSTPAPAPLPSTGVPMVTNDSTTSNEANLSTHASIFGTATANANRDSLFSDGSDNEFSDNDTGLFGGATSVEVKPQEKANTVSSSGGSGSSLFGNVSSNLSAEAAKKDVSATKPTPQTKLFGGVSSLDSKPSSSSTLFQPDNSSTNLFGNDNPVSSPSTTKQTSSTDLFGNATSSAAPIESAFSKAVKKSSSGNLFGNDGDSNWSDEEEEKPTALFGAASNFSTPSTVEPKISDSSAMIKDALASKPKHSTLFGGSDDDSESSDDEGGLFGTGLPSK